ncbi:hypothetical protein FB451DRAFT_1339428 [Mycena latifolia]|nr:hypothetical protein FB451DRAFT_1339428 [Mycena latifolia]
MSALLTPLELGSITIRNRIGMPALTRDRSTDTRALGGAGLIVSEGNHITRYGMEMQHVPGIWDKVQVAGWKKITDAVHEAGGKMFCSHPEAPQQIRAGVPVYGPSAVAARGGKFRFIPGAPGFVTPTEITDPTAFVALFKAAAINAKEAGFDGVELHGTNGYLVEQFLDSTANHAHRSNRARFALEVLKAFVDVWGHNVALKISPTGGANDVGMPLDETIATFGYLLREVNKLELAYVTLMRYNEMMDPEYDVLTPCLRQKRGTPHDVLATYGPLLHSTPTFVNSGVTPAEAEELVRSGAVAGVFFGLPWITHPDVARRIEAGKPLDNVPDVENFYGAENADLEVGYLDYNAAVY